MLGLFFSALKTIYFNFRYIEWTKAYKFPVVLTYSTKVCIKGKLELPKRVSFGLVRIGFHRVAICNNSDETSIIIESGGVLSFEGSAHLGNGTKIFVARNANFVLGDNFAVSASSAFNCYKRIQFGRDIQFSWDCLVMDSDTHNIYNEDGDHINKDCEIIFGDKIWVGCRTLILKGSHIPSNTVIGAGSLVSGHNFVPNTIILGRPAKSIKKISSWKL